MSVTRLVLVRHGESVATVEQVVGGHDGCRGLSPRGRRQAEALRDRLAATGEAAADVILTSIMPRAVETADIIAPALGGLPVAQDCDLCEIHPGESDGLSWEEYGRRYNVDMRADPLAPIAPGGESLTDFHGRVSKALLRIVEEHAGRTVVLVCHGGVVAGSFLTFFGLSVDQALHVSVWTENTALTEWACEGDGLWRLVRHNDTAHLMGVEP